MKNLNRIFGIVILAAVIVFTMASCGDGAGGGGGGSMGGGGVSGGGGDGIDTGADTFETGNCILKIPTVDEEFVYLMNILSVKIIYPEIGQTMTVPGDPAVNAYIAAKKNFPYTTGDAVDAAYEALKKAFYERIYKRGDYVSGFNAYKATLTTFTEKAVPVYAEYERIWGELPLPAPFQGTYGYEDYWGLHVPEKYIIQLSLYGNNGQYLKSYSDYDGINSDPVLNDLRKTWYDLEEIYEAAIKSNDSDAIDRAFEDRERAWYAYNDALERARNDPRFGIKDTVFITVSKTGHKGMLSPIELIMHETGHQALNNVDYSTPHERLCELFITHLFGRTLIPNYRVTLQPSSNQIDEIFGKADVLEKLPQYLMEFRQKYGLSLHPYDH